MRMALMVILGFFLGHWFLAAFVQVFFLHRYSSHQQFVLSPGWEKFFHLLTYVGMGSSYLPPRAYAIIHRQHHAYSDGPKDPHSPQNHPWVPHFMLATSKNFDDVAMRRVPVEPRFEGGYPSWPALERLGWWMPGQIAWGVFYAGIYVAFASTRWLWLLIPVHVLMGLLQGMLVNWCGHRYGYRNYDTRDRSTNALCVDLLMLGDMQQNNHHRQPMRPSTAVKWFELDVVGLVVRGLIAVGIAKSRRFKAVVPAEVVPVPVV